MFMCQDKQRKNKQYVAINEFTISMEFTVHSGRIERVWREFRLVAEKTQFK